jgi:hypothetical protein
MTGSGDLTIGRVDASGEHRELGVLVQENRVRVLNCGPSGCLLESDRPLRVGTVATIHLSICGRTFSDVVEVVRCTGTGRTAGGHQVAAQFLATTPPYAGSLRHVMRRDCSELAWWMTANEGR